MHSLH